MLPHVVFGDSLRVGWAMVARAGSQWPIGAPMEDNNNLARILETSLPIPAPYLVQPLPKLFPKTKTPSQHPP